MFKSIETFVLQARRNKGKRSAEDVEGETKISFVNSFPARDRAFLSNLAKELNLVLTWDEYNDKDENLAVLRLPVSSNGAKNGNGENKDEESSEDDGGEAGNFAVDRVLNKYKRATTLEDEGTAEERYEVELKRRMDDWKRDYYRVSFRCILLNCLLTDM
jgi:5'-3' exoribonuclease 1